MIPTMKLAASNLVTDEREESVNVWAKRGRNCDKKAFVPLPDIICLFQLHVETERGLLSHYWD